MWGGWRTQLFQHDAAEVLFAGAEEQGAGGEVGRGEDALFVGDAVIAEVGATALDQPARLAGGGAQAGVDQQLADTDAGLNLSPGQGGGGQFGGRLGGLDARHRAGGGDGTRGIGEAELGASGEVGLARRGGAVGEGGGLVGEDFLGAVDLGRGQGAEAPDFVHGQGGEEAEEPGHFAVIDIPPELVVVVRGGAGGVEPDGAGGGLAEFLAVALEQQREGGGVGLLAGELADEAGAGDDIAPLVLAAELQFAAIILVQDVEVVGLQEHVIEFEERQAGFQPLFDRLGGEHLVDVEVPADVAQEIQVFDVPQPVGVVDQAGAGGVAEVEEAGELALDGAGVGVDLVHGEHGARIGLAGGVADHGGAAADNGDGTVAALL